MPLSKARDRERKRLMRARVVQPVSNPNTNTLVQPKSPLYNPAIHRPGDRVLVRPRYGKSKALIEMVIPELDADGTPIPE